MGKIKTLLATVVMGFLATAQANAGNTSATFGVTGRVLSVEMRQNDLDQPHDSWVNLLVFEGFANYEIFVRCPGPADCWDAEAFAWLLCSTPTEQEIADPDIPGFTINRKFCPPAENFNQCVQASGLVQQHPNNGSVRRGALLQAVAVGNVKDDHCDP